MVKNGELTQAQADSVACDPAAEASRINALIRSAAPARAASGPLVATSAPLAAAVACAGGGLYMASMPYHYEYTSIAEAGWMDVRLTWCYTGTTVHSWSGACTGGTTAYGTALGISWDGCVNDAFIQYSLGGYYPGGVERYAQGAFGENYINFPQVTTTVVKIWGHGNGTCDHQFGMGAIYNYC